MLNKAERDPVIDEIHRVREDIAKETKGMSWQERNVYLEKETAGFMKELEDYKYKVKLEKNVVDYYKELFGSSYDKAINEDLLKMVELRKSLKV